MPLTDQQRCFLNTVRSFSGAKPYLGMMPRRVVTSCDQREVLRSFFSGYVAFVTRSLSKRDVVEGLVLTDKGLKVLSEQ